MKRATLVVAISFVLQIVQTATIPELRELANILRQNVELQYSAAIQSSMNSHIAELKSTLNSKAETLKNDISKGPSKCRSTWISRVQNMQKQQINLQKTYEPCKMQDAMTKLKNMKYQFDPIIRSLNDLEDRCRNNCQNEVDGLENALYQVDGSVKMLVADITQKFVRCMSEQQRKIDAMLDDARKNWMKCR